MFALGWHHHHNLSIPKVPVNGHMKGNVGDHDQVLTEREQGVNYKTYTTNKHVRSGMRRVSYTIRNTVNTLIRSNIMSTDG